MKHAFPARAAAIATAFFFGFFPPPLVRRSQGMERKWSKVPSFRPLFADKDARMMKAWTAKSCQSRWEAVFRTG